MTEFAGMRGFSRQAFAALGALDLAYVREVRVEGRRSYAIRAADGRELAVVADRDIAFTMARQNDMEPMSVH